MVQGLEHPSRKLRLCFQLRLTAACCKLPLTASLVQNQSHSHPTKVTYKDKLLFNSFTICISLKLHCLILSVLCIGWMKSDYGCFSAVCFVHTLSVPKIHLCSWSLSFFFFFLESFYLSFYCVGFYYGSHAHFLCSFSFCLTFDWFQSFALYMMISVNHLVHETWCIHIWITFKYVSGTSIAGLWSTSSAALYNVICLINYWEKWAKISHSDDEF